MSALLKNFKKISQDGKIVTLKHPQGKEFKIAMCGLSPNFRQQLADLPIYMAEGGDVKKADEDKSDEDENKEESAQPEPITDSAQNEPMNAEPQSTDYPQNMPLVQSGPVQGPMQLQMAQPMVNEAQQAAGFQPANMAMEMKDHDMKWAQDLANQHITPETYSSLFAKKDTLGKIGTIFGLMLSGIGSGLTGQPNQLMEMMNREINNDLEAQKQSKANAQNFIRLNQQHQLNESQMKRLATENALTKAQTGALEAKTPAEIARLQQETKLGEAQVAEAQKEAAIKGDTLAHMQMNRAALHSLSQQVQKLPEGSPERQKAEQTLGLLSTQIDTMNSNLADKAAAMQALNLSINPSQVAGNQAEQNFQANQRMLRLGGQEKLANDNESKHFPGIQGLASVPLSAEDRGTIQSGKALQESIQRLKDFSKKHANSIDPKVINEGKALAAQVQGDFRMATHGGVYKEGEQNFIDQIIPSDPTKFVPNVRVVPKLDAVLNETNQRTNQFLRSKGFDAGTPAQQAIAKKPPSSGAIPVERTTADGRVALFDPKTKQFLRYKDQSAIAQESP